MPIIKSYRKQLVAKFRTRRDQALVIVGRQAVGFVKPLVPVDSGFLRSSITFATAEVPASPTREAGASSVKRKGKTVAGKHAGKTITATLNDVVKQPSAGHVVIGTNVHYAPHIEYGTVKIKRQPFLRPGVLNNKQILANTFAKAFKGLG